MQKQEILKLAQGLSTSKGCPRHAWLAGTFTGNMSACYVSSICVGMLSEGIQQRATADCMNLTQGWVDERLHEQKTA